tara:strand:+ start:1209 stop:2267 length:1059 start_codon:yes stop_codon:yes gene_type:complete
MPDTKVMLPSEPIYGLKAETTFGADMDANTNYLAQPVVQAEKPTFNIQRESRLLSGRGGIKNSADTIVNTRGGTVTMPFDMIATPKTLLQHAVLVAQQHSVSTNLNEIKIDGGNSTSIGGTITSGMPHSVNMAYKTTDGNGIQVGGMVCSDLTIAGDVGANNGLVSVSGNYFSGFSNPVAGTLLEKSFGGTFVDPQTTYFNVMDFDTRTLDMDGSENSAFIMKSFSFNIANGVNRVGFDTNGNAELYVFPEYVVTGSLVVKLDDNFDYSSGANVIQSFLNGDTLSLNMICGDSEPNASGEMEITAEIQLTDDPAQDVSESGIFHTLNFECVKSDSTPAFKLQVFESTALTAL